MTVQKIKSGRIPGLDADNFVGDNGQLFFNEGVGDLRLGDGVTPGGIPLSVGGGGGGGGYILPTASTTVKGGVKVDGTTITVASQIISVGTVPYSSISGTPTIPTNNNQLSNGAGYITGSALSGYATESFVTTRGYLTSVSWNDVTSKPTLFSGSYNDLTNKPTIPTNNNQLTNGAGYITSSALSGYATETYVTTRGYLTAVSWNDVQSKPTFATLATSGSYTDLSNKPTLFSGIYNDLTNKPTIPTDINQLTDASGLLGQGGGGTTYVTNNVENPYAFNVAADDSTLREISNGETLRFQGATGITITSDTEGKITITGPDLSSYATQSYVTSQGFITSSALSGYATETYVTTAVNNLVNGAPQILDTLQELAASLNNDSNAVANLLTELNKKANVSDLVLTIAGDDSTERVISLGEGIRLQGTGSVTITTDIEGKITINGAAPNLAGYATESYVTTRGYLTTVDWSIITSKPSFFSGSYNDLTDKPNLAGTYTWNIAADDSTLRAVNSDNVIKFVGGTGITTSSDTDGNITINGFSGSWNDLTDKPASSALNANGTLSMPLLSTQPNNLAAGQIALANGTNWDPLQKNEGKPYLTIYTGTAWVEIGGITTTQVYQQILELT